MVSRYEATSFSCEVQPSDEVSVSGDHVGQHGLRWKFINESIQSNWNNWADSEYNDTLALSMQVPTNWGETHSSVMRGWFVAPATTNYRFYMACDDWCRLNLGNTPMNASDTTEINYNTAWNEIRNYWDISNTWGNPNRTSQWIALEEGEHYYIQGQHLEGTGGDHFSVAVEIEATADNTTFGHH